MEKKPQIRLSTLTLFLMQVLQCTIFFLIGGSTPLVITAPQDETFARFYRRHYMDNMIMNTSESATSQIGVRLNVSTTSQCAAICLWIESCGSFFHVSGEGRCQMHSILFLAADKAVSSPGSTYWQLTQDSCPHRDGFVLYRPLSLCYKFHSQQVYWDNARDACAAQGTSLLKVENDQKFQHMYTFLRGSTATRQTHVSIGATEVSGTLKWLDGSDVTWTNWATGEPSSSAENCVVMAWFYFFKWNDVPCNADATALYGFVCQKAI